jgi:molecular chaperone DnaK
LGGDNFDKILVDWLIDDFNKNEKIDLSRDVQALQRLTEATEKAKIELSTIKKTQINLPFITADQTGPKHIDKELTRELFEKLCKDLIDYCKTPVEKALNDAEITKLDIDEVVLVGGSTRIPAIQELVKTMTNKKINQNVNPDEVVAIGAAIQAGILAGEIKDILLLDVTPLSLGIETLGGVMTKVIPRNTTVPVRRSELFSTALDNQTSVEIHILQGERELVLGNKSLGRFGLTNIPEAEKGIPQIDVTFDLNVDGLLNVTAKERATGVEQFISLKDTSNLNEEEIKKMLEDAKKYAESDLDQKETIEAQNESEDFCLEIESFLLTYEKTKQLEKNTKESSNSIFHLLDLLKFQVRNGKLNRVELSSFTEGINFLNSGLQILYSPVRIWVPP